MALPVPSGSAKLTGTVAGTAGSYQGKGNTAANAFDGHPGTFFDAPAAAWVARAAMPNGRHHLGAAALNGIAYAVGGNHPYGSTTGNGAEVDAYDPVANAWTRVAPLPVGWSNIETATMVVNGKIVIVGGRTHGGSDVRPGHRCLGPRRQAARGQPAAVGRLRQRPTDRRRGLGRRPRRVAPEPDVGDDAGALTRGVRPDRGDG